MLNVNWGYNWCYNGSNGLIAAPIQIKHGHSIVCHTDGRSIETTIGVVVNRLLGIGFQNQTILIKHVYSKYPYQRPIYEKYGRRVKNRPSGVYQETGKASYPLG